MFKHPFNFPQPRMQKPPPIRSFQATAQKRKEAEKTVIATAAYTSELQATAPVYIYIK